MLLVALLAMPIGVHATTDSLTVASGSATNAYVPIYGNYSDVVQHNQMIYPASMLTSMVGQNIYGLKFFIGGNWTVTQATISLAVVTDTTLLQLDTTTTLTPVWSGPLSHGIDVRFAAAFAYTGGSLLVDIQTLGGGSYSSSSAQGIARSGAARYGYDFFGFSESACDFLPKACFYYTDGDFCSAPSAPAMVSSTGEALTFSWSPGGIEIEWETMVGDSIATSILDTFVTVYGLTPSTQYPVKVRAVCGVGDTSNWSSEVMMTTQCGAIESLPWTHGFEGVAAGDIPVCWTRTPIVYNNIFGGGTTNAPSVSTSSARTGNASLYMGWMTYYTLTNAGPAVIATPPIVHDPTNLHVVFYSRGQLDAGCTLEAGILTDPTDLTSFVPVLTLDGDDLPSAYGAPYAMFEFYTSTLTTLTPNDVISLAFRMTIGTSATLYEVSIDDITIEVPATCVAPSEGSGVIDSVSYEAVQLSWHTRIMPDAFDVMVEDTVANTFTHHSATDTTLLVTGLASNTIYRAYAASVCSGDTTDYTYLGIFTTHRRCYTVQQAACGAITANSAMLTWDFSPRGIAASNVEIVLIDVVDSTISVFNAVGTNTYVLTNLNEGHLYQATLRVFCGDNDTSTSVTVQFTPHSPACAEVSGSGISNSLPFNSYYKYGFSESLYDATIIEGVDTINGIAIEVAQALDRNNLIDIYMGYTTLNSLEGASSYVPVSGLTQVVANYQLSTANVGWTDTVPFSTPFITQPTGDSLNLVIAFFNHTGSYTSGLRCRTHTSTIGNSCYRNTDNAITAAAPWGTTAGGVTSDAPNIKLYGNCGGGGCMAPSPYVSHVDTEAVTLVWLPGNNETSWTVQYRPNGSSVWTTAGTTTAQPYTVTGLNPGTINLFRVGSECADTVVFSPVVTATTLCGRMHAPLSIIPDGNNNCWAFAGSSGFSTTYNSYYIYASGTITTPQLADSVSGLQVKMRCRGSQYYVGVADASGNTTWIDTVTLSSDGYETRKTYLDSYSGNGEYIVIKAPIGNSNLYVKSITIEPRDLCLPASDLSVDNVASTEAWLSWQSDNDSFLVRYRAYSDTLGAWLTYGATATSAHLTGLNPNDYYYVELYNVCPDGSRSDSIVAEFATVCLSYTAPYAEHFQNGGMPLCWSTVTSGNVDESWANTAEYGTGYLYSSAGYYGSGAASDWLMTPVIQLPADASNYQLVYLCSGGPETLLSGSLATYEVRLSTTGSGNTAAYTTVLLVDTIDNMADYNLNFTDKHISLAAYGGQAVSFAFINKSRQSGVVAIDDVEVRDAASPVYSVTGESIAYVGDSNYYYAIYQEGVLAGMTLGWTSTMAMAGNAVVDGAASDVMSIVYTVEGVDTITFIANNGYGADTHTLFVRVYDCSPVRDFPYIESFESEDAPAGCWTLVYGNGDPTRNPMIHTTSVNNYLPGIPDGNRVFRFSSYYSTSNYSQFLISRELSGTDMLLSFQYAKQNTSLERLRVGYSATDRDTNSFAWQPWIADTSISYTQWRQYTDSIPEGTRFVAIQYASPRYFYAYIDNLTITGSAACLSPVVGDIVRGEDNLTISYSAEVDSVEVIVSASGFNPNEPSVVVTASPYVATGLNHSTEYFIAMRSLCEGGHYSEWTVVADSTLTIDCVPPANLTVVSTTFNSVELGWTVQGNESLWEVEAYNTLGSTIQTAATNPYTFTGLTSGMTYNLRVRALCGQNSNLPGDWSDVVQATPDECPGVTGVGVGDITETSAKVNWQPVQGSLGYKVYYGIADFEDAEAAVVDVAATATDYTMSGLTLGSNYEVYVLNRCTETLYSNVTTDDRVAFTTLGVNGIYDVENGTLTLFPNPASDKVNVTVGGFEGEVEVEIVDMNGRRVAGYTTKDSELTINVSDLAQGAYFVRVTGATHTAVRKLIVK